MGLKEENGGRDRWSARICSEVLSHVSLSSHFTTGFLLGKCGADE